MAGILVVDDDGIVRDALRALLTRAGHSVELAADGDAGLAAFGRLRPDLVILDRNLPGMNGSKVFASIRAAAPAAAIIILSGYDDPGDRDIYLGHGAAAFLSKNDGLSGVLPAVERALAQARAGAAPPPAVKN